MKQYRFNSAIVVSLAALFALVNCVHSSKQVVTSGNESETGSEFPKPYYETDFTENLGPKRNVADANKRGKFRVGTELCGKDQIKLPRVMIDMRPGYCVGIAASEEDGLIAPRTIAQIPNSPHFIVVDFGGWQPANNGKVFRLEQVGSTFQLKVLFKNLDQPHGLAIGLDGKAYVATHNEVFRFDPLSDTPGKTVNTIVRDLPGKSFTMLSGMKITENSHPLKQIVFDKDGNLYINIGGPSDACLAYRDANGLCVPGETARPTGAIWKYIPQNGKLFSGIKVGEANPKMEVMARGLRNSIAMLVHPKYPEPGYAFLQGENSRDFQDPAQPAEEINSIVPGKHYGWPYCFNNSEVSPEYADFLARDPNYRNLCKGGGVVQYQAPHTLLPPHSSPLDMKYYTSNRFPELRGKLLVTLHGWSATGARFGFLNVDAYGFPVKNSSALSYNQNCKEKTYITTAVGEPVGGSQFEELTAGWHSVGGKRPHGRPVGMAVANDGAIWVIDDINKAILRVDASMDQPEPLPCDIRTEAEIAEIIGFIEADPAKRSELTLIRKTLVEKHCTGCHSDFDLRSGMNEQERDRSVAHYLLAQPGWVIPPYAQKSTVHIRTRGKGFGRQMPGNARELLAKDDEFAATINTLDHWIRTIVPGQIHEVRLAKETHMRIRDQAGTVCGRVPNKEVVLVVDNAPKEKPGFMRIYKPAGEFLDGDCLQGSKYYMGKDYLFPTTIERNPASAPESLFMSQPVTAKGEFGPGIEGPATSKDGRLFVPSFQGKKNSIGVVDKNGKVSKFIDLPKEAKINALRIDSAGSMFAADYSEHKIYKIDLSTKVAVVHAFDKSMNQPNDIALDSSGAIYATDPNWKKKSGRVWRVSKDGSLKVVASELGAVNGIDLSHDGKTLYVGDSTRTEVHAFDIIGETLTNKRTLIKFKDGEIDGIKVDSKGNLYVARITLGVIAKVSADGKIIREIPVNGAEPTNLTFGGADGRTIFVTQRKGGFIESFRVDDPGREF